MPPTQEAPGALWFPLSSRSQSTRNDCRAGVQTPRPQDGQGHHTTGAHAPSAGVMFTILTNVASLHPRSCSAGPLFTEATEGNRLAGSHFPRLVAAQQRCFIHRDFTGFLPAYRLPSSSTKSVSWARVLVPTQRQPRSLPLLGPGGQRRGKAAGGGVRGQGAAGSLPLHLSLIRGH